MAEPRTAKDALLAEILGDIDKLNEAVEDLKQRLPEQLEAAETRLAKIIVILDKAGENYQQAIVEYTKSQGEHISDQIQKQAQQAKSGLQKDYEGLIHSAKKQVAADVKAALQAEITLPYKQIDQLIKGKILRAFLVTSLVGLVTGLVFAFAIATISNSQDDKDAAIGKAVAAAWPTLDKKAKATIEAELSKP